MVDAWPGRRRFHYGDLGFHAGRAAVGQRSFLFAKRDGLYILLALGLALVTLRLPMEFWQRHSTAMLIASIVMLLIVPVVGSSVNGASRWIALGPLRIQPAEFTKLSLFCYIANYRCVKAMRSGITCAAS